MGILFDPTLKLTLGVWGENLTDTSKRNRDRRDGQPFTSLRTSELWAAKEADENHINVRCLGSLMSRYL